MYYIIIWFFDYIGNVAKDGNKKHILRIMKMQCSDMTWQVFTYFAPKIITHQFPYCTQIGNIPPAPTPAFDSQHIPPQLRNILLCTQSTEGYLNSKSGGY